MPTVKVSEIFKQGFDDWYDLYVDFHSYKLGGIRPRTFGQDAPLEDKFQLHHIHLATEDHVLLRWANVRDPNRRTHLKGDPESDHWLVYAYDDFLEEYLLLLLMGPDAHNRDEWGSVLRNVVQDIVEPWALGRVKYDEPE